MKQIFNVNPYFGNCLLVCRRARNARPYMGRSSGRGGRVYWARSGRTAPYRL